MLPSPICIFELKIAAPASLMSNVNAVIVEPPSLPLNIISLSWTFDDITKSLLLFVNVPIAVPSSLIITSAPSASNIISPPESSVSGLPAIVAPVVPSCVIVTSLSTPNDNTESSVRSLTSFPKIQSNTTDNPPSV